MCWCRNLGASLSQKEKQMVCLPCRQFTHTHESRRLVWSGVSTWDKLKSKFHPSITQPLALFYGMLLVAQTNLLTLPTVLPAGPCPSVEHAQPSPPHHCSLPLDQMTNCWLHFDTKSNQRIPGMCQMVFYPPLALSPSECMHQSISISHSAFGATLAGSLIRQLGKDEHTHGKPATGTMLQQPGWALESSS